MQEQMDSISKEMEILRNNPKNASDYKQCNTNQ
jgi:hypothetical protein